MGHSLMLIGSSRSRRGDCVSFEKERHVCTSLFHLRISHSSLSSHFAFSSVE